MNMKKLSILFFLFLGACTIGPSPNDPAYLNAVSNFPEAKSAQFITNIRFQSPNENYDKYMSGILSPYKTFFGRLFVTPEKLIVVGLDKKSQRFIPVFEVTYRAIDSYGTRKALDTSLTYFILTGGKNYQLITTNPLDMNGNEVDSDDVLNYIKSKVGKQS